MLTEKSARAEVLRAEGWSVTEIAAELHVTRQRVRQLLATALTWRQRQLSPDPFARLSARTANGLRAEFVYVRKQMLTVEAVAQAWRAGRLHTVRNLGKKSVAEIACWLAEVHGRSERELPSSGADLLPHRSPPPCPRP